MNIAISAAVVLKKVLGVLASDEKGRHFLLYVVGITLFILMLPMIVLIGLFGYASDTTDIPIDQNIVMSRLSDEDMAQMAELFIDPHGDTAPLPIADMSIDASRFSNPSTKNRLDLVNYAEQALEKGWGYTNGTFGRVLTEDTLNLLIQLYPEKVGINERIIRRKWLGKRTADCIGLVKGYCWFNPDTGGYDYQSNGLIDYDIQSFYDAAVVKGSIDSIPEIPGLAVWWNNHMGIYVGNGYVIHANTYQTGVVKEKLSDYPWTHWMQIPTIQYS